MTNEQKLDRARIERGHATFRLEQAERRLEESRREVVRAQESQWCASLLVTELEGKL